MIALEEIKHKPQTVMSNKHNKSWYKKLKQNKTRKKLSSFVALVHASGMVTTLEYQIIPSKPIT